MINGSDAVKMTAFFFFERVSLVNQDPKDRYHVKFWWTASVFLLLSP